MAYQKQDAKKRNSRTEIQMAHRTQQALYLPARVSQRASGGDEKARN